MEIMRTSPSRSIQCLSALCSVVITASAFAVGGSTLQNIAVLSVDQGTPTSDYRLASRAIGTSADKSGAALLSDNPSVGYTVANGTTTIVVSLPKIQTIDSVSFFNSGAKGRVTVATSNAKLPATSPRWRQVAREDLGNDTVNAALGPNEAKYIRITFEVTGPGQISALGVYSPPGTYALLATDAPRTNNVESDSKTVADAKDAKDLGDKEIPAEGPAEGPPPNLPDPPPFTFTPVLVPTSP